jgi:acetyl esterase/lipase
MELRAARRLPVILAAAISAVSCADPAAAPQIHGAEPEDAAEDVVSSCALPSDPPGVADETIFYKPSDPDHGYAVVTTPPAGTAVTGWVILIHGGSWQIGSPRDADMEETAHKLAGLGYLAVRPAYRLVPTAIHPAQVSDVRCAARWVRDHAGAYGAPARGFIGGASAGAHLAMLTALAPDDADDLDTGDCPWSGPVSFHGAIGWGGVYDVEDIGFPDWVGDAITALLGRAPAADPAGADAASPIGYLGPDSPPILLAHGEGDGVVPFMQSAAMHARAIACGAQSTFVLVTSAASGWHGGPLFDAARPEVGCTAMRFLAEH